MEFVLHFIWAPVTGFEKSELQEAKVAIRHAQAPRHMDA
jgi:hypothetical protein